MEVRWPYHTNNENPSSYKSFFFLIFLCVRLSTLTKQMRVKQRVGSERWVHTAGGWRQDIEQKLSANQRGEWSWGAYYIAIVWYSSERRYQDTKIPRCQDVKMPRCQDTKIPRYQDTKMPWRGRNQWRSRGIAWLTRGPRPFLPGAFFSACDNYLNQITGGAWTRLQEELEPDCRRGLNQIAGVAYTRLQEKLTPDCRKSLHQIAGEAWTR